MKNSIINSILFVLLIAPQTLLAGKSDGGSSTGGGGGGVVLPDDKIVLADPYYKRESIVDPKQPVCNGIVAKLHPLLMAELKRIDHLLNVYGGEKIIPKHGSIYYETKFYLNHIEWATYCFVTELPKTIETPDLGGKEFIPIAYTEEDITWILADVFKRMNIREQAKLILHERLHAFNKMLSHKHIIDITNGISVALDLYNRQLNRERPVLIQEQIKALETLVVTIDLIGLNNKLLLEDFDWKRYMGEFYIYPNGGGLVHKNAAIDASAYVGIGSYLPDRSHIGANSVLIDSRFCSVLKKHVDDMSNSKELRKEWNKKIHYYIGNNVVLENAWIGFCNKSATIMDGTVVINTMISMQSWNSKSFKIGKESFLSNVILNDPNKLNIGDHTAIMDSVINITDNGKTMRIMRFGSDLWIGNNVSILNLPKLEIAGSRSNNPFIKRNLGFLKINNNSQMDFENKPVCTKKKNAWENYLSIQGKETVNSKKQLRKLCKK